MEINAAQRELTIKLVYYGPALSGKTTNLRALHAAVDGSVRGRLMTLDTADDRTLFFDLLPIFVKTSNGVRVKVKLFTVPGQVMHNSTRRVVLSRADGIAFIADAQANQRQSNFDYWRNMTENLRENGMSPDDLPIVIQFNKCDLVERAMLDEIEAMRKVELRPILRATAIRGDGVVETFLKLVSETYDHLDARHDLKGRVGMDKEEFLGEVQRGFTAPVGARAF